MKVARCTTYGPPEIIAIADAPIPSPCPGEVLVRVTAAAVTRADARLRAADAPRGFGLLMRLAFGLIRPRHPVPGMYFAGIVDAPAPGLAQGQRVMGRTGLRGGAHAEYLVLPANGCIFSTPDSLSDAQAAAFFFGGVTAADFLIDKARLQPSERILINGATGEVGVAAVQIARHLGAHVTAVARSENHDFARQIGADDVLDYRNGPPQGQWDVVMDIAGTLPWSRSKALLAPKGRLLPVTATLVATLGAALRPRRGGRYILGGVVADTKPAMQRLLRLHAEGAFHPVVSETFPLSDIRVAHARAESGHKRGAIVVTMG